jgi:hypothetical protein
LNFSGEEVITAPYPMFLAHRVWDRSRRVQPTRYSPHALAARGDRSTPQGERGYVPCDARPESDNPDLVLFEGVSRKRGFGRMSEDSRSQVRPVEFENVITERQPALSWNMQKAETRVHAHSNDCPCTLPERDRERVIEHRTDRGSRVARFRGSDRSLDRWSGSHDERAPVIRYSIAAYAQLRAPEPHEKGNYTLDSLTFSC